MVSIIVPVYNTASCLSECIQSVLNQSYPDIELLLIDDQSTDESGDICDYYASIDPRVRVFHQEKNFGVSRARNRGIENAVGDYIFFADSDDFLEPRGVELLINTIKTHDIEWAIGNVNHLHYGKDGVSPRDAACISNIGFKPSSAFTDIPLFRNICSHLEIYVVWGRLFSRSVIIQNNIRFDEKLSFNEDILFNLCYAANVKGAYSIEDRVYNHCFRDELRAQRLSFNIIQGNYIETLELFCKRLTELSTFQRGHGKQPFMPQYEIEQYYSTYIIRTIMNMASSRYDYSFWELVQKVRCEILILDGLDAKIRKFDNKIKNGSKLVPLFLRYKSAFLVVCSAKLHIFKQKLIARYNGKSKA